jgi:hypothetical protein
MSLIEDNEKKPYDKNDFEPKHNVNVNVKFERQNYAGNEKKLSD